MNGITPSRETGDMTVHCDNDLTLFLHNDVYVSVFLETYEYFQTPHVSMAAIEVFIHSHPFEEDLLDFAIILDLNLSRNVEELIREIEDSICEGLEQVFLVVTHHTKYNLLGQTHQHYNKHKNPQSAARPTNVYNSNHHHQRQYPVDVLLSQCRHTNTWSTNWRHKALHFTWTSYPTFKQSHSSNGNQRDR